MKQIEALGFQGDIGFLRVDEHVRKAFKAMTGADIFDIIADKTRRISHALKGDGVLAAGLHPEKGMVLAQGESRAHYHAFRDPDAIELYPVNDNMRLMLVKKEEPLRHEEHDPIGFIPAATPDALENQVIYIQFGQFEYGYEDEYRRVAD